MVKARSRLKTGPKQPEDKVTPIRQYNSAMVEPGDPTPRTESSPRHKKSSRSISWITYFKHLPTLVLSLIFYGILFIILTRVDPDTIKNVIAPGFYLPFLLILFLANLFLFSFLFLNSKRGLFYSLLLTTIVFLKMQSVVFTWQVITTFIVLFLSYEGFALFFRLRR